MNKIFTIVILISLSIAVINAETNGVWHNAEDVRPGEFASDESGGDFRFHQNVDINNNLGVGTNSIISGNPAQNSYIIGNFGVGDTTPLNQLSVESTAGNVVIGITSNGLTYSSIDFYNGANNKWGIGKDSSDNFYIDEFGVANRLSVIQGTGYVGINTYTPRAELEVDGTIIAKNLKIDNGSGVQDLDDIYVNENQPNSITSPMIVDGTIIADDISSNYYLWKAKTVSYSGINKLIFTDDSQTQIVIGSNTGEDNNLARVKLYVSGDNTDNALPLYLSNKNHAIGFSPYTSNGGFNPLTMAGDQVIQFSNGVKNTGNLAIVPWSDTASGIRITTAGNVGIGISNPAAKLHIVNDGAGAELLLDAPSGDVSGIRFAIDGSDKFFIGGAEDALMLGKIDPAVSNMATIFLTNLRDVGIGISNPAAKLHVAGNIIANNPTQNNHVATKQYVDTAVSGAGGSLNYFKTSTSYFTYTHTTPNQFNQIGTSVSCPAGSYLVSCTFCRGSGCNPDLIGLSVDRNFATVSDWEGQVEYYFGQTDSRTCRASINAMFRSTEYNTNGWKTSIEGPYGVAAWCIQMT